MNYSLSFYKVRNLTEKITIVDFSVLLMIVATNAFPEYREIRLVSQIFALSLVLINSIYINRQVPWYLIWGLVFISYNLLSWFWAPNTSSTLVSMSISIIQVILIGFIIILYCISNEKVDRLIAFFLVSSLVITIRFFIEIPISWWGQGFRFDKNTIFGSNRTAMVLSYSSLILIPYIKKNKYLMLPMLLFSLIAFLMGTKKGVIVLITGVSSFYLVNRRIRFKNILFFIGTISTIIILILRTEILYNSIGYRFEGFFSLILEGEGDGSTRARLFFIEEAVNIFLANPFFGIGLDGFRYSVSQMTYSHSNYLELLANTGIFGFSIYYFLPIYLWIKSLKFARKGILEARISFAIISAILINDFFAVTYETEYVFILIALVYSRVIERKLNLVQGCQ